MAATVKQKKIPERRCVGCGSSFPKKDLIRVVKSADGVVSLDFTGKKSGRGAYICANAACFRKAVKAKRFESNLDCSIPEDVILALQNELEQNGKK